MSDEKHETRDPGEPVVEKPPAVPSDITRETSAASLREERDSNFGGRRALAHKLLLERGPMTARELDREAGVSGLWKRLSDLERDGFVFIAGKRPCRVTGKNVVAWVACRDPLPVESRRRGPRDRRKTTSVHIHDTIACAECRELHLHGWNAAKRELARQGDLFA